MEITNISVKNILKKRGFFDDIRIVSEILKPIHDSILILERNNTTLADCYLQLLQIAYFFKNISTNDYKILKTSCIKVFNKR